MKSLYIINSKIVFDAEENSLSLHGEEENMVELAPPASRLLYHLIMGQGALISREVLLQRVWEDYGFRASNNNLNNYLSMLRKNIALLDPDANIIVTLPKQGFKLEAEICVYDMLEQDDNPEQAQTESDQENILEIPPFFHKVRPPFMAAVAAGVFAFVIGVLFYCVSMPGNGVTLSDGRFLMAKGKCDIYSLDKSPQPDAVVNTAVEQVMLSIDCEKETYDVFLSVFEERQRQKMRFISWCQRRAERLYTQCKNTKWAEWGKIA